MLFVGIDIGKNNHVASMMDENGKVVFKAFSFPNTTDGGNALFFKLSSYSSNPSDFLHVINPIQTDGWRKGTEIRKRKNDTIDSVLIADLIRYGQFVETRLGKRFIRNPGRTACTTQQAESWRPKSRAVEGGRFFFLWDHLCQKQLYLSTESTD